jgi:trehalose 6-phosphate synthase/phosphatase
MSRILIVSNRLPVTAKLEDGRVTVEPSPGGLATGLRGVHDRTEGLWIGWPGELPRLSAKRRRCLEEKLSELRVAPVYLTDREVKGFYEDIANGVLWPLFSYILAELPLDVKHWDIYRAVNEKIADAVVEHHRPGDLIWVHDYHLMLVPQMLRRRLPDARIGFFLHIPFPSSEIFSMLPWREEILDGLLGADLIGVHTSSYMRHLAASLRGIMGLDVDVERVCYQGREVQLGVFPMGVDARAWSIRGNSPEVLARAKQIKEDAGSRKIIVGIDRLDYTKGLLRRLLAVERVLEREPALREEIRLIQVTVPSREKVESYGNLRRRIDELVGRINGKYATPGTVPIHRLHQSLPATEVAALYRAADVMLVTPLRDGMNLVAKEFVATRSDEDGVLVLSEFAGAAAELGEALRVNPYDIDRVADRIREALAMPKPERRRRMRALRHQVASNNVRRWSEAFIGALEQATAERKPANGFSSPSEVRRLVRVLRKSRLLVLVLNYDGTLVPLGDGAEQSAPDPDLTELLTMLASRPGWRVHVVSGRSRDTMERWFGQLPIGIHAEHGLWSRLQGDDEWRLLRAMDTGWLDKVRPIMERFVSNTRGSRIEQRTASIVWDHRSVEPGSAMDGDFGESQSRELRVLLGEILDRAPADVIAGHKSVEVRPMGINKGQVAPLVLAEGPAVVLVIGDDDTDEDLFAALPEEALTVRVGQGISRAKYRLSNPSQVRRILRELLDVSS